MLLEQIVSNNLRETQAKHLVKKAVPKQLNTLYSDILQCLTKKTFNPSIKLYLRSKQQFALLKKIQRYLVKSAKKRIFKYEYNQNGTRIIRGYTLLACRDYAEQLNEDWELFYSASSSHKYWLNIKSLTIVCYCHGDVITRIAKDTNMLLKEKQTIINWFYDH